MTNDDQQVQGQTLAAQNLLEKGAPIEQVKQMFPLAQLDQVNIQAESSQAPEQSIFSQIMGKTKELSGYNTAKAVFDKTAQAVGSTRFANPIMQSLPVPLTGYLQPPPQQPQEQPAPAPAPVSPPVSPPVSQVATPSKPGTLPPATGPTEGPSIPTREQKEASLLPKENKGLKWFAIALSGIADTIAGVSNAAYGTNLKPDRMKDVMQMQKDLREKLRKEVSEKVSKDPNIQEARQIQDAIIQSQNLKPESPEADNIRKMSLFDIASDPYKMILAANNSRQLQKENQAFTTQQQREKIASDEKIAGVKVGQEATKVQGEKDVKFKEETATLNQGMAAIKTLEEEAKRWYEAPIIGNREVSQEAATSLKTAYIRALGSNPTPRQLEQLDKLIPSSPRSEWNQGNFQKALPAIKATIQRAIDDKKSQYSQTDQFSGWKVIK